MDNDYHDVLIKKVEEYHELYFISKQIKHYGTTYLNTNSYYVNRFNWSSFENSLRNQIERLSLHIKKHVVSYEEHREKLRLIHKGIKCGLNRYLFQSKYKGDRKNIKMFNNKQFPENIQEYISTFLNARDQLSIKFASVYQNKQVLETMFKTMTVSTLKQFPFVYNHQAHYREDTNICKRPMNKLLKSYTKNKLIDLLVDNFDHLYTNFRSYDLTHEEINAIHHCNVSIDNDWPYDRICGLNKYSIYFDPYYIPKNYMVYCLKILCGTQMYNKNKITNKKGKSVSKKKSTKKSKAS